MTIEISAVSAAGGVVDPTARSAAATASAAAATAAGMAVDAKANPTLTATAITNAGGDTVARAATLFAQSIALWDAATLSALADGASVVAVHDDSGNGNDLYAVATDGPGPTKATVGGKPVIRFSGSQVLRAATMGAAEPSPAPVAAPVTIVAAVRVSSTQVNSGGDFVRSGATGGLRISTDAATGALSVVGNSLTNAGTLFAPPLNDDAWHIINVTIDAASTNIYEDDFLQSSITGAVLGALSVVQPLIGLNLVFDLGKIIVWSRKLTAKELSSVNAALSDERGIGLNTKRSGLDATFRFESGTTADGSTTRMFTPSSPASDPVLVLFLHQQGGTEAIGPGNFPWPFARAALARGWYVAASSMGAAGTPGGSASSWGNPTAQTSLLNLYNAMAAKIGTAPKVILLGASMGGGAAALAIQKGTLPNVKGAWLADAALSLRTMYQVAAYTAGIDSAYGITAGTLSADAAANATSISSSVSFAAGTSILIDPLGANPELVTTTGAPTGSGPYAIPVPALGFAHLSGVKVSDYGTKTAGSDPMLASVAAFANLALRFTASTTDPLVLQSKHTDPFRARITGAKENSLLQHIGGHLAAPMVNPRDFTSFVDRAIT